MPRGITLRALQYVKSHPAGIAGVIIAVYFLALTRDAWHSYFTLDDGMNLHQAVYFPLGVILKACIFWIKPSTFARPLGGLWYRSIYALAGFNPVPFHVLTLLVLMGNIWFTYSLARRLSGSREIGVLAALLISYHPGFTLLYFDTGYVYDVLCYFFYFAALLFYVRIRQQERRLKWWEVGALTALYMCAVDSKELALTLPLFLLVYEWLYEERRSLRGIVVTGILTLTYALGLLTDKNSLLSLGPYHPVFSWDRWMVSSRGFINPLFFQENVLGTAAVVLLWIALFALAWGTRSRVLKFAWLFLMLSVAPVAFITPRGPAQYYIPFFGWVLYAAAVLVTGSKALLRARFAAVRAPALFLALTALLFFAFNRTAWADSPFVALEGEMLRTLTDQMRHAHPVVRPGSKLLFVDDPLRSATDDMTHLARLIYRDMTLKVDRVRAAAAQDPKLIAGHDYVFHYQLGRFFTRVQSQPVGPVVVFEWGQPDVFHSDWARVTRQNPARSGEMLISKVSGLGETKPLVAVGQAFPKDLVEVAGKVEVWIAGKPAEVVNKFGWPEEVNQYRLDFRVPVTHGGGNVPLVISALGVAGPEVDIRVK